ncbi:hypothetical protein JRO89_XS04G0023300 [Xanthoceras sorbifolium]|uniref:Cytochrome P450 n=1 Tax=Xanthoceras sorbifolium TaxID=99658 RepID=A0ABQ8I3V6_9ROSI|nr:hypothetical protein JRO89_XS04G0023300 [Xanthoceras sorbifolium]
MELPFVCALILFTLFISMSLAYLLFNKHTSSYTNLPPGKMGLPYIGESLEFINAGRKGHPEKFIFDRINKYSSQLFKTSILAQPTVVFCGPAANKFLFSNENKLVKVYGPESTKKIFPSSQEEFKMVKKMIVNILKPEALMRYTSVMDSIAQKFFASDWEGKQQVIVFPLVKSFTFCVACKVFLSIEDPQHVAKLANPFDSVISGLFSIPINFPGTAFNRAIKASKEIRDELIAIIKQRKIDLDDQENKSISPTQDILSQMLSATDENGQRVNELEIADYILLLLIAGHETTSSVITFTVKYLAELPHIYNEVFKEQMEIAKSKKPGELLHWEDIQKMKYSWNVACEVMRLIPPIQGNFREAITDFTFSGFSIPMGWKLFWSAPSTHKNPECFKEPEKFDPTRFEGNGPAPYTFVPFGGGPRMCPGKEYARLKILVFIHNVIKRFNWEKLIPDEKTIVDPTPNPAKGLPVRLIPHQA